MNKRYESFGEFLAAKQSDRRMTYRQLADRIDCSIPYISDVEKGRRLPPELKKLKKLAQLLDLSAGEEEDI